MSKVTIEKATISMVDEVVPLFDAYRQFYGHTSSLTEERKFLTERLSREESVIFLAFGGTHAVGFAQLYPSFSSLLMSGAWILNDLFVHPGAREHGVGAMLLAECRKRANETGAKELSLETMKTNLTAQRLYEASGWKRDETFYKYYLTV